MRDSLDLLVPLSALVWAFPIVFLIHDGEELLAQPRSKQINRSLPAWLARHGWLCGPWTYLVDISRSRLVAGVAFILALVVMVTLRTISAVRAGGNLHIFTLAVAMLLLNAFTHIVLALLARGCTPGAATSVLVLLPYCTYTLHRLSLSGQGVATLDGHVLGLAAIALLAILATAHLFARIVVR